MKIKRMKALSEALMKQLEKEKDKNANLAGYGHLPEAQKETVYNVPDSSLYKEPNNNTCISYWEKITGYKIKDNLTYYCPACGGKMSKETSTLGGAHVYKKGKHNEWFFVPLCSTCNNPDNKQEMEVDTILVPVPLECYEKKSIE